MNAREQADSDQAELPARSSTICETCKGTGWYSPSGGITDTIDECPECEGKGCRELLPRKNDD